MEHKAIKNIVVVGGGTAGWMAAATFIKLLGDAVRVTLVESDEIATVGVGEATIPAIRTFNRMLGIDEADFLRATHGTYKLGIEFKNWAREGDSYIHAFGSHIGVGLGSLPFHHYWLRAQSDGAAGSLWDYSINAVAAKQNKFSTIEKVMDTKLSGMFYAYHFDASLFAKYLRNYSEKLGVNRVEGKITRVDLNPDSGFIKSVVLENQTEVNGDLFIDCSGFRGLLIEGALQTGYEDWTHWLPCDRAVAVPCESVAPLTPYTRSTAHSAGWQWRIPLQHRTGNGHVYSSQYISDDEAASILVKNVDGNLLAEPRFLKFTTGMRKKIWNKNCVAIGLASGFMEPLESTSIHLVQAALVKLIDFFPADDFSAADIDEYNRQMRYEYENIRNFIILHYHANEKSDEAFWQYCRNMPVPEGLTQKIALFKSHGRIYREANELFSEVAWLQVMHGQRIKPTGYHPLADRISSAQLKDFMANLQQIIENTVGKMPAHEDFIARCRSPE